MEAGVLEVVSISDLGSLQQFSELTERLGRGEAACLVVAEAAGYSIASDERGLFARLVSERLGTERLLTTPDLYVAAIRAGVLTVADADTDKATLEGRRFRMRFASFADLIEGAP
jgi:predicted nucleic acid-binding protein